MKAPSLERALALLEEAVVGEEGLTQEVEVHLPALWLQLDPEVKFRLHRWALGYGEGPLLPLALGVRAELAKRSVRWK